MEDTHLTVSELARRLNCAPKIITGAFYSRLLPDDIAPIRAGRRLIPIGEVDFITSTLRRYGKLPPLEVK